MKKVIITESLYIYLQNNILSEKERVESLLKELSNSEEFEVKEDIKKVDNENNKDEDKK